MLLHAILLALAPIFFVMALGYIAGRLHRIDNQHVAGLNSLVMDFAVPAALFVATASTSHGEMMSQGSLFAVLGVGMMIPYALWYLYRVRLSKLPSGEAAVESITVALPNFAAAGLPLLVAVIGPKEAVHVAIAIAAGSILPSPVTLLVLELSGVNAHSNTQSFGMRAASALGRALAKPIVLAPILGIVLSMLGLTPGDVVGDSFQLIGQASGGAALFLTGLILSAQPFRMDRQVAAATIISNVLQPMLVAALVFGLPIPLSLAKVAILLTALPAGFFGILFGANYRTPSADAGSMVLASTVFSIITLPIAIALLYPRGG